MSELFRVAVLHGVLRAQIKGLADPVCIWCTRRQQLGQHASLSICDSTAPSERMHLCLSNEVLSSLCPDQPRRTHEKQVTRNRILTWRSLHAAPPMQLASFERLPGRLINCEDWCSARHLMGPPRQYIAFGAAVWPHIYSIATCLVCAFGSIQKSVNSLSMTGAM